MKDTKTHFQYFLFPLLLLVVVMISFFPTLFGSGTEKRAFDQPIDPMILTEYKSDIILLFFGYAGCVDVCTPRLQEIADIYRSIEKKNKVKVLFINLIPPEDLALPDRFARFFHPDFTGIYPGEKTLALFKKEFNLYMVRSLFDKNEYDHTAYLFLLQRAENGYNLRYIYTEVPFNKALILKDINKMMEK